LILGLPLAFGWFQTVEDLADANARIPWMRWANRVPWLGRAQGAILAGFGVALALVDVVRFR